ncbi:hypothetical protein CAC42_718 [Sphaceloma murrayae]|uniref:CPAF-like PDZ domain-containing protein n=1 Tax=Sphaceloma murrayae TaxID=2082308 RepID=A0A2K1QKQ4_9PEZI|nr:hypothetical protein CAC42_718 [Sphaceloma murrayae]
MYSRLALVASTAGLAAAYPQVNLPGVGITATSVYTPPIPTTQTFYRGTGGVTITPNITAAPTSTPTTDACAKVAELSASFVSASPAAAPSVPAQVGFECLNSIPFNQSAAEDLVDAILPYIDWQTTSSYLGDPGAEYAEKVQAPYDFLGSLAEIRANVSSGYYKSEYEFGWTLYRLFQLSHDGHLVYFPDTVNGLISFGRRTPLVSVSPDGKSAPRPYLYSDVLSSQLGNGSFTPSAVVEIDGIEATEFLEVWSQYGSLQDPDALYNNLFYNPAQIALGSSGAGTGTFSGGGRGRWPYPGPTTTLTFENGTVLETENYARLLVSFAGIRNGADIYNTYLTVPPEAFDGVAELAMSDAASSTTTTAGNSTTSAAPTATSTAASTTVPAPGYPSPVVRQPLNFNSGYFLEGEGFEDVAVLAVNSFVGAANQQVSFKDVNTRFIAAAKAAGKKKLIIDVSANGGGTILLGYDLFAQLFPTILPYGANRFRFHEAYDLLGQQTSELAGQFERTLDQNQTVLDLLATTFNYRTDVDVNYENFESWDDKTSPTARGPLADNYTSIIRWNVSDILTPENSGGIYITGYGNGSTPGPQPFATEDIIVVYDGYCASTCTIFSEFMRRQAGVKTIALGGRSTTDIIQAVGGVKGTNSYPWTFILGSLLETYENSVESVKAAWRESAIGRYNQLPLFRGINYVVNARDGFSNVVETETPLQFVYEAADCRILYTPAMVVDQSEVWRAVADSVWGGDSACVAGDVAVGNGTQTTTRKQRRSVGKRNVAGNVDVEGIWRSFDLETENGVLDTDGYMLP